MKPCFLNVDLEITSASNLDAVIAEMGKCVIVLHSGPAAARKKRLFVMMPNRVKAYRAVGLGWLLAPAGWPVLGWFFDGLYAVFARYRVRLRRLFGRSCATGACGSAIPMRKQRPPEA